MKKILVLLFLFTLIFKIDTHATHIKAGEILAERDASNPNRYTFTIVIYYSIDALNKIPSLIDKLPEIDFGDNTTGIAQFASSGGQVDVGNDTKRGTYKIAYTYSGAGTFKIGFVENNRIANILNMAFTKDGQSFSNSTPFYLENQVTISPFLGRNSTPVLTVPPIDLANKGQIYTHNPGAYDPDGDSMTFELIPPKKDRDLNVDNYVSPADGKFNGETTGGAPATFVIDPKTGQITWDTPGEPGYYNIAIKVNEYRNGRLLGYVIRDMQIEVKNSTNQAPQVSFNTSPCIVANLEYKTDVIGKDPDQSQSIIMNAFGSMFETSPLATFTPLTNPVTNPTTKLFRWTPTCATVQEQPYQALFKVEDNVVSDQRLAVIKNLQMKVLAPAPVIDSVTLVNGNQARIKWKRYNKLCNRECTLEIYRKTCDSTYSYDPCTKASITPTGYELIYQAQASDSIYIDNNLSQGLIRGLKYYYMIIAKFPGPRFGNSIESNIKSLSLNLNIPLITTVSVLSETQIQIRWLKPQDNSLLGSFGYKILRSIDGINFNQIQKFYNINSLVDSNFTDSNLDTKINNYAYKIQFYYGSDTLQTRTSDPKSIIKLVAISKNKSIDLTLSSLFPYQSNKTKIYNANTNLLLDSITNGAKTYTSVGLKNCEEYCYYIEDEGSFCVSGRQSYINRSNIACETPKDVSQNPPVLSYKPNLCSSSNCSTVLNAPYIDTLSWLPGGNGSCLGANVYKLYYAPFSGEKHELLVTVNDTFYVHAKNTSFAGCYYVTSVINGIESTSSNEICIDNDCACFELPNIITPNGDQKNDIFKPFPTPKFVNSVEFRVYNRYGKLIFSKNNDININWDAQDLADGIYYYEADVQMIRVKKSDQTKTVKGWVHVIK